MRPFRARGRVSRAGALDERCSRRGAPDLRARGLRARRERTSYELRKEARRTELALAAVALAQRLAKVLGRPTGVTERDPRRADRIDSESARNELRRRLAWSEITGTERPHVSAPRREGIDAARAGQGEWAGGIHDDGFPVVEIG